MRAIILTACLLAAGCATKPLIWDKPGGSQAEFDTDSRYCDFEVKKATQTYDQTLRSPVGQGIEMGMRRRDLMASCMRMKGYTARQ